MGDHRVTRIWPTYVQSVGQTGDHQVRVAAFCPTCRQWQEVDLDAIISMRGRTFWHCWPIAAATGLASPAASQFGPALYERCRAFLVRLLQPVLAIGVVAVTEALLAEFGSLSRVLAACGTAHVRVLGDQPRVVSYLALVGQAMLHALLHALSSDVASVPLLNNTEVLARYLHVAMAHELREHVRALFLNTRCRLIRDQTVSSGTVTLADVHPRVILRRTLELGATSLIAAHNHPSGNPEPSRADIAMTRAMVAAARTLQVEVSDHLVIARDGDTSMHGFGLI